MKTTNLRDRNLRDHEKMELKFANGESTTIFSLNLQLRNVFLNKESKPFYKENLWQKF